jgi:hypothetical protein
MDSIVKQGERHIDPNHTPSKLLKYRLTNMKKEYSVKLNSIVLTIIASIGLVSWSYISKPSPTLTVTENCSIDQVSNAGLANSNFKTTRGEVFYVSGWMANPDTNEIPKKIKVVITDEKGSIFQSKEGLVEKQRVDVGNFFNNNAIENSGYVIKLDSISEFGKYRIQIIGEYEESLTACSKIIELLVN